jgi:transcriptional regulator with XRE-family HTH domain
MTQMDRDKGDEGPHAIDRHVGLRIRMRRQELKLSQEKLAQELGLTFQQVQKYERGANRVSASKLWEISRTLRVTPSYFYESLDAAADDLGGGLPPAFREFLLTSEGQELVRTLPTVRESVRRKILDLVRTMVGEEEADRRVIKAVK